MNISGKHFNFEKKNPYLQLWNSIWH